MRCLASLAFGNDVVIPCSGFYFLYPLKYIVFSPAIAFLLLLILLNYIFIFNSHARHLDRPPGLEIVTAVVLQHAGVTSVLKTALKSCTND